MTVGINFLFTNGMKIPFEIAGLCLEKLIAAGILKETSGQAHDHIFQAGETPQAMEIRTRDHVWRRKGSEFEPLHVLPPGRVHTRRASLRAIVR